MSRVPRDCRFVVEFVWRVPRDCRFVVQFVNGEFLGTVDLLFNSYVSSSSGRESPKEKALLKHFLVPSSIYTSHP